MLAIKKSRKGVTLYKVKQQNNVDIVVVLYFLSLVATLSMYSIDWFNLANVRNIVITFIRNYSRVFLVSTSLYLDWRWKLQLTITASVRWEIRMNLMIFCVSFTVKGTWKESFKVKVAGCNFTNCNFTKINFFEGFFKFDLNVWTNHFQIATFIYCFHSSCFHRNSFFIETTVFSPINGHSKRRTPLISGQIFFQWPFLVKIS